MACAGLIQAPLRLGPKGFSRIMRIDREWHDLHIREPTQHWYLLGVGVHPQHQGAGIGKALLEPVLNATDENGLTCYLETQTARNVKFYEKLGFSVFGGDIEKNYLIMKNGNALIGLFQGMFENNILTFNPGWDENAQKQEVFDDVRDIQKKLKENGVQLATEADETTSGPASIVLIDPDGNAILIDQHV